jgi:peptidoglycan/LPS O-acetylase OafA/YrhL
VLLVVFDHLQLGFPGGYIGVDVFFVISGYLISRVILTEMLAGEFRVSRFYERRIRRIFPALFVMLFAVGIFASFDFLPAELIAVARSLVSAVFSVSNFYFWHQAGYFAGESALKPLLHTWSLAVEEQFYIMFPLFLMAVMRWFPRHLKAAIWMVLGLSFVLASLWVTRDPSGAFFLAPLRAWELLIGTLLAQNYVPVIRSSAGRNVAAVAGLLAILIPGLLYSAKTSFPGMAALPPCLGAALLIAAGEYGPTIVGRVLTLSPVRFIGLISYSLYLWHWPLLVFQKTSSILVDAPSGSSASRAAVFAASIVVATLSWRFVEMPFRQGKFRPTRRMVFVTSAVASLLLVTGAASLMAAHGLPGRFSPQSLQVAQEDDQQLYNGFREGVCFLTPKDSFRDFQVSTCLGPNADGRETLLFGDSHAAHLYPGLAKVFPELKISQATAANCLPLLKEPLLEPGFAANCEKMLDFVFRDYMIHHKVDTVLLAGHWAEGDLGELGRTILWLQQHGMQVVLFGPFVEYDMPLPRLLAFSARDPKSTVSGHRLAEPQRLEMEMSGLAKNEWNVRYVSIYQDLCHENGTIDWRTASPMDCPVYAEPGVPLLFDEHHFTAQGSTILAEAMRTRNQLP